MEEAFNAYFIDPFATSGPSKGDIIRCLQNIECKVTAEMNERISRLFTRLEVGKVLKQIAPLKSPGFDGFGTCFYQNHWSIVSENVCQVGLSILNSGTLS